MLFWSVNNINEETDTYVTKTKYHRETGLPISQRTFLHDKLQTPPDDSPSEVLFDEFGRPQYLTWHEAGVTHREGKPAIVELNPESGEPWVEGFFTRGRPIHRSIGPYRIVRDWDSGEVVKQIRYGDPEFPEHETEGPVEPGY